jgi:solute carrier family 34 (sodium-dependent phosphate cotransporter)
MKVNERLNLPLRVASLLLLLYGFLVGITVLSGAVKLLGSGVISPEAMAETTNPFMGLMIGILATTLVQSSSVTTSLVVGMVGGGMIDVATAVPMVMGANIGTTVTSSIAALGSVGNRIEFRRAFAAATCHDFFNYMAVLVLLPLELATGYLQKSSFAIAGWFTAGSAETYKSPFKASLKACYKAIKSTVDGFYDTPGTSAKVMLAAVGMVLIFTALVLIVKVMRSLVLDRMQHFLNRVFDRTALIGIIVGALLTVAAQSSSITTSVMVPLAGAGLITLRQIFPIVLGANIGTTVTAMIAAVAVVGDAALAARQIAVVHLLFNMTAIGLIYAIPKAIEVPLTLAARMAAIADRSKRWAILYIVGIFYGLPALLFMISKMI